MPQFKDKAWGYLKVKSLIEIYYALLINIIKRKGGMIKLPGRCQ